MPTVHPFIEAHPEAVFIRRTSVASKTDSPGKLQAGLDLAKELFTLSETPGIPLTNAVALKPNLTYTYGFGMELWCQRTCDNHSVSQAGLSIIEGVFGRNGNGFELGPDPDGKAEDILTNIIFFGKNPFLVDIIATWVAGHEPGNFGLFHIGKERGFLSSFNPHDIPLYRWDTQGPTLTPLESIARTPIVTYYLRKDYNGQNEALYHLVNEPYEYAGVGMPAKPRRPSLGILGKCVSKRGGTSVVIECRLPVETRTLVEIFNARGQRVAVLMNQRMKKGVHAMQWNTRGFAAGPYFCTLRIPGYCETKQVTLL
jgi:hypothetical protein